MEYNLNKQIVQKEKILLDTVSQQAIDMDITLPDYCQDIEKILKCTLTNNIYSRSVSGGELTIDGESVIRILYVDSNKKNIRCFEQSSDFSASFELKETPLEYAVLVDTKTEYINCRALSPRKLTVHGAFSLYAKVISKVEEEYYCLDDTDCDLQTKEKEIFVCDMIALCQEHFSVSDDFSVNDKPPVESVLSYDVTAEITECKCVSDKLMLSSEISLHLMYLSDIESGQIEHISYVFPYNQIVDCEGACEDAVTQCTLDVTSCDLHIRNDAVNDSSLLSLDTKLCFTAFLYKNKDIKIIEDAYSTDYLTDIEKTPLSVCCDKNIIKHSFIQNERISLDDIMIDKVINVSGKMLSVNAIKEQDGVKFLCKANVKMIFIDKDETPMYIERTLEYECDVNSTFDFDTVMNACGRVASVSYRLSSDNEIELRIESKLSATLCKSIKTNVVNSVTSFEDKPIEKSNSSLILCYADKGESIWDISKSYLTKPKRLLDENSLESDILQSSMMLLIPTE